MRPLEPESHHRMPWGEAIQRIAERLLSGCRNEIICRTRSWGRNHITRHARFYQLFLILLILLLSFQPAQANPAYNWLITIETEFLNKHFDFDGTALKSLVETSISTAATNGAGTAYGYEDMWYCNGKPYGLERYGALSITPGDGVAIEVVHSTNQPALAEIKAAADAILRMLVDARLNHNIVHVVIVPANSFQSILAELQNHNFIPTTHQLDRPYSASVSIFLIDTLDQQKQNLCYSF
jgi:hypothetical protein